MARNLTKDELIEHKKQALAKLDHYITSLIDDSDPKIQSKADKLSYWLEDWTTFLDYEPVFSPAKLRRYKRGEIIKAHLGYNVGSEEGGLHYCVVLDKQNALHSPIITVVPLTSVKAHTNLEHLPNGNIYLGNELFTSLNSKIALVNKTMHTRLNALEKPMKELTDDIPEEELRRLENEINLCQRELHLLKRLGIEVSKMKRGSIAIVSQIRTISKIRIYDPKTNYDILSNVKLSNEKLDLIDTEMVRNYTGRKNV